MWQEGEAERTDKTKGGDGGERCIEKTGDGRQEKIWKKVTRTQQHRERSHVMANSLSYMQEMRGSSTSMWMRLYTMLSGPSADDSVVWLTQKLLILYRRK